MFTESSHSAQIPIIDNGEEESPKSIKELLAHQWENNRLHLLTKISLVSIFFIGLGLNSGINLFSGTKEVKCFEDTVQTLFLDVTFYLGDKAHKALLHWYIGLSSLLVDICMLSTFIIWIWWGKSLRMFFVIFFFYMTRAVTQKMFATTFPDHYVFEDPGVFSIGVPYFKTNDFFFSGHIGICTIFFSEFRYTKARILQWVAVAALIMNGSMLLLTEGHFSIDLTVGVVIGHWPYSLGFWLQDVLRGNPEGGFAKLVISKPGNSPQNKVLKDIVLSRLLSFVKIIETLRDVQMRNCNRFYRKVLYCCPFRFLNRYDFLY